nr:hypothetical protein [Mycoplasmopsis bovis]
MQQIFSSYAKDNYGSFPFISAYGNDLKNDRDELSKNNYYRCWLWSYWENT